MLKKTDNETEEVKKIGIVKFLKKNPQEKMIEALLKNSKYKDSVMAESEWFATLDKILGKQITQ